MERQRKDNIKRGERTQKMFSFRIDQANFDYMVNLGVKNKGRFINECLREKLSSMLEGGE